MFTKVELNNFLAFDHIDVNLRTKRFESKPLVLLFGENASGKTSFIKSFAFLKQSMELLLFNRTFETRTKSLFENQYCPQDLANLVEEHYHRFSSKEMKVSFEIYINKVMYRYDLEVDLNGTVVEETLTRRHASKKSIVFARYNETYELGYGMVRGTTKVILQSLFEKYSNNYTLLSILYYGIDMTTLDAKDTLKVFTEYIANMYIKVDGYDYDKRHNFLRDFNLQPHAGITNRRGKEFLEVGSVILTELLSTIFFEIENVRYVFTQKTKYLYEYEVIVTVLSKKGSCDLKYSDLTRSMKQTIDLITSYIGRSTGSAVLIDDVAESWNRVVLSQYFLDSVPTESQSILTLSSLDAINYVESYSIYFTERNDYDFKITPLESFKSPRVSHNIRKGYEEGRYIKANESKKPEFYKYDIWFKDKLDSIYNEYKKGKSKK